MKVRQQSLTVRVVDRNAQEVLVGDVRRLRTRRTDVEHVRDATLLQCLRRHGILL